MILFTVITIMICLTAITTLLFPPAVICSEFRDVVFEDVVFDNNRFYLYPVLRFCLICGHRTIIIKHHILKHHIPELPNYT